MFETTRNASPQCSSFNATIIHFVMDASADTEADAHQLLNRTFYK